jgi:hypothetical protein
MAIFTAIATAIVEFAIGATVVAGTAAAFAVSAVATGLAIITSRLINGTGSRGGGGSQDQGVRIQLPPNTETKIPVVYGSVHQQGIITDARISNSNKTMTYVLTLSETTNTGTYTCDKIYWNDQQLVFKADGYTVDHSITSDLTTNTNFNSIVRAWVYAGGSSSTYQISGPTPAVNAYDVIPDTTSTYAMNNLVFGVVQIDYTPDKGVTALPTITFKINNSLSNPGAVWYDYMTAERYGAGFATTEVDSISSISTTTSTSLYSISNEIPANQYLYGGTTASTQVRYEINGVLNTGDTIKTNLEKINLSSSSYTAYDHKEGRWRIIPNRKLSTQELDNCYVFTDDNIIGDITLTSTNLEDLYNSVEVSFASRVNRDQTDYYRYALSPAARNTLEPNNKLQLNTALVNNSIHAGRIGLMELTASRYDQMITFQTDYAGLQVEAGDVVKITNSVLAFDAKPFRVIRMRETEGEDATLAAEVTAIEYNDEVYYDNTLTDTGAFIPSGIAPNNSSGSLPPPGKPYVTAETNFFTVSADIAANSYPIDTVIFYANPDPAFPPATDIPLQSNWIPPLTSGQTGYYVNYGTSPVAYGDWYFRAITQRNINGQMVSSNYSAVSDKFSWS